MESINGRDLYQMFNYGTYYIMKERSYLNDINVFPVADGDTGNNLLQTLRTIVVESKMEESFSNTLDSISNSALIGARGNSGVIFAQFVNGLQKSNGTKDSVSMEEFTKLVEYSFEHTYSSLSNPVEGTMITIMRDFSVALKKSLSTVKTIKDFFQSAYSRIKESLTDTTKMLDVLTENDVVDSGAMGFVLFVQGIVSYYNNDEVDISEYEDVEHIDEHHYEGELTYRYCTEGLVKYTKLEETKLKSDLEVYGDSLIVAQGKNRFRVHIHTNTPELVFQTLNKYGDLETQKIDDMKLEMSIKNTDKKRVIVTDSIADIGKEILDDNNVVVIPVNISIDNKPYLDKLSINNQILFESLNKYAEYPKTATPSIKYINDLFSKLLLKFDEILVITVSKELSATHNVIKQEIEKIKTKGKEIYIVDSYNNSATEGLIVLEAIEMMKENIETKEIIKKLEKSREKTEILVCLETFKYATMSGRLPKIVGKIGMFFGIRPIMSLKKGKGAAFGMALSQKGITKKIKKFVEKDVLETGIERYSIVHCLNEKLALEYKDLFTNIIGYEPSYMTEISSATAIHSGVGSVAIGYIKK
jgi:DegV family protein with EDD domain